MGEDPSKSGGSLRALDGFPITHFSRLLGGKVGCLVSITVTCTFLKSNRFLLVGVFLFRGIGTARLTQRLSQPSAADTPDNSLDSPASRSQSLLVISPPPSPEAEQSLSRPPPTLSPHRLPTLLCHREWKYQPAMEPGASSRSYPGQPHGVAVHAAAVLFYTDLFFDHYILCITVFFLLTSQG